MAFRSMPDILNSLVNQSGLRVNNKEFKIVRLMMDLSQPFEEVLDLNSNYVFKSIYLTSSSFITEDLKLIYSTNDQNMNYETILYEENLFGIKNYTFIQDFYFTSGDELKISLSNNNIEAGTAYATITLELI